MREQWNSGAGFVLATIGCAAGLGNIWRFAYVAGENGGAAFLLVYIVFVMALGLPLMLGEFCIGRRAHADAVVSFSGNETSRKWRGAGWLMAFVSFLLLSYYAVVAGWAYKYFVTYLNGVPKSDGGDYSEYFTAFIAHPVEPLMWQLLVLVLTVAVVVAGVKRGIELANKVLMPLLGLIIILLAAYSLSLDGAHAGLAFLFRPDWSALLRSEVYLAALGQAFFSLGIGAGALLTYGSYTSSEQKLAPAALTVAIGDTLFAVVAGMAIFPAVFAFGLAPDQGPTLAFVTLPEVFNVLPGGRLFAVAFFLLLGLAALTSSVSILEVPSAVLMNRFNWSRRKSAIVIGTAAFVVGVPSALGFGVLKHVTVLGMGIMQLVDGIASNILLPVGGLLVAVYVGWNWRTVDARRISGIESDALGFVWLFSLRFFAPALILLILLGLALA